MSQVTEFNECVRFVPFDSESRRAKFDAKLQDGIWLGLDNRTDENIIGTAYGVYRASTVKAVHQEDRWDAEKVLGVTGMPWDPTPNIEGDDGARLPDPGAADGDVVPKDAEPPEPIIRKMYIRKRDVLEYGETPGCLGCTNTMLGKAQQSHTVLRRERI